MKVDIYDFDKTVVPFDSALKYWTFCLKRCPWIWILLPFQFLLGMSMLVGFISVKSCKTICFSFIRIINNEKMVSKFWDVNQKYVFDWFKKENRKRPALVVSASPNFLLEEIAKRLEVEYLISTNHDSKTGLLIGEICRKAEKVVRIKEKYGDFVICDVYSDNKDSDRYLFELGENCFHTTKGEIVQFDFKDIDVGVKKSKIY